MDFPKRYEPKDSEKKWQEYWIKKNIYKFDPDSKKELFSIDTPPPTVSGKMHIGHAFSYTHQDIVARYKRMRGFNLFYPFGTDDNGLATERLVEKMKGVKGSQISREDFQKLCLETLEKELRPAYIADWKRIGMSCDWDIFYTTLSDYSKEISQRMFLDLVKKNRVERKEAPFMWCPHCQTALAQVELEDLEKDSHLNDIMVKTTDGDELVFATTRPELYYACIAISVHPDDDRYKHLVGKEVKMPLSGSVVPVIAEEMTKMDFGTGIVYWCPYSDASSIEFVSKHPELKVISMMGKDGKLNEKAGPYEGLTVEEAREKILEDLEKEGALVSKKPIKHVANVHERCGTPIEFLVTKQWFIKYLDLRDRFLERGDELNWFPQHMKNRYDNWVKGLQWDWCISRQRFSGVPIPVWYDKETNEPVFPKEEELPVNPLKDLPKGYKKDQLIPEKDVLDTWATSSLTPRITAELFKDHKVFKKLLPMNLRPQAHDIITFWLFNTVVRSHLHDDELPWKDCMISGWALDPHGKKMSKSKGNVIEPQEMIEKYSSDALRFWTAGSKLGDDLPFQEKDLVTGQKIITKLWNASKFVLMNLEDFDGKEPELEAMDRWLMDMFNTVVLNCTNSFEKYEFSRTKLEVENFFWNVFCDYYLEIVKDRLYNPGKRGENARKSAQFACYHVLSGVLKMFAPIMPHITEEIYHLHFAKEEGLDSIHNSTWPEFDKDRSDESAKSVGDAVIRVIAESRKFKTESNLSMGSQLKSITITSDVDLGEAKEDILGTTRAKSVEFAKGEFKVDVQG